MPFILPAVVSGLAGSLASGSLGLGALAFGSELLLVGARAVLGRSARAPRPSPLAGGRTINLRQPIQYRRAIYGEVRTGGAIVYIGTSAARSQLNIVLALAGHEVAAITDVMFDDAALESFTPKPGVDPGEVAAGRFKKRVLVSRHFGGAPQGADLFLQTATSEWTSAHRLDGIAYIAVQLVSNPGETVFSGLPTVSARVRGKRVFDPRDGATRWSPNPALALRDYLIDTELGLGLEPAKIDEDELIAAANLCEEMVALKATGDGFVAEPASATLARTSGEARWIVGDGVELASTGTLPGGLAAGVLYHVIPLSETRFQLATSYANALAGTAIAFTTAGSGAHSVTRVAEPRYSLNGSYESDQEPGRIIEEMLSAMAGKLVISGGRWIVRAGAYVPPSVFIGPDDLRGPIEADTKLPRRERFNAVKGVFLSPDNDWQPSDYPAATDAAAEAADGGRVFAELDLPYTISSGMAQRLAKIALLRARQEKSATLRLKLAGFRLMASDTVAVSYPRFGWENKPFEVISWRFAAEGDEAGTPAFGIDITVRETAPGVYDYDADAEQVAAALKAPATIEDVLALVPGDVGGFSVAQSGDKVNFRWNAVADTQLSGYEIRFGPRASTSWENATPLTRITKGTSITNALVPPGDHRFFIKALNTVGAGNESVNAAAFDAVIVNALTIAIQRQQAPDWPGTRTGLVRHWTGVLVAESADGDARADDVFEDCVPRPLAQGFYEAPEQDLGQDAAARIWAEIDSVLCPGAGGLAAPEHQIDHRRDSGAFDGFEPWAFGTVTARHVRQRLRLDSATGLAVIRGFLPTVDLETRTETFAALAVAAGGTTVAFAAPFLKTPFLSPTVIGGGALIPAVSAVTTASFRIDLFNAAGVSVGGTADIKAEGI